MIKRICVHLSHHRQALCGLVVSGTPYTALEAHGKSFWLCQLQTLDPHQRHVHQQHPLACYAVHLMPPAAALPSPCAVAGAAPAVFASEAAASWTAAAAGVLGGSVFEACCW